MTKTMMPKMRHAALVSWLLAAGAMPAAYAQNGNDNGGLHISGSIQSDVLIPQEDPSIGTQDYPEWALTNTYAEVNATSRYVDAGARFEFLKHPMPGFDKDFRGWGVPYFYVKGKLRKVEVTLGSFYEQFGSGLVLRTYEERSLGIDNSLQGARVVATPLKGVTLKALTGRQRRYWAHNDSWVTGADAEVQLEEWIPSLAKNNYYWMMGGSFVTKHEGQGSNAVMIDPTTRLVFPENVAAWDVRSRVQHGPYNVLLEYARKSQDPSFENGYLYRRGQAALLSASYSKRGMSVLLQAKRSENMSYRSRRGMSDISSFINNLPPFTMQHTYTLASLYPYATQNVPGEWAFQGEAAFNLKKKTWLGGRYGTKLKFNVSHIRSLKRDADMDLPGNDGNGSSFFGMGHDTYYQDANVQMERRLSKDFELHLMYMNQRYNKTVVEGEGGLVKSNIFVADGKYRISRKVTLRSELQYLTTAQDYGDWAFGLVELSVLPHFMFTVSDLYNVSDTHMEAHGGVKGYQHYYNAGVTWSWHAHRLMLSYGRTRAGFNCSGGVCRYVPAMRGLMASYNLTF